MWVGEHLRRRYATQEYAEEYENWKSRHVQSDGEGILCFMTSSRHTNNVNQLNSALILIGCRTLRRSG